MILTDVVLELAVLVLMRVQPRGVSGKSSVLDRVPP